MPRPTARLKQRPLFCPCGTNSPAVAGFCRSCYRQLLHSRARFGGHRHLVLERDGHACRICGAPNQRTVHHRRPREHAPELLITVCPACHARLHHLAALRRYVPPALVPFWAEQHPHTALQLQLDFEPGAHG
jgi:5-methylcytosine-specific restriction endonuclease McrA